jgi:hypothetical protein
MRSVKYREYEIPIFETQNFSSDKIVRDTEYQNYWLKHSQLFDVNVSFFAEDLSGLEESVLCNLKNEPVLFKVSGRYKLMNIVSCVESDIYSIADCEDIGKTINIVNFNYHVEKSSLDINAIKRCIKIQNILNH